MRTGTIASFGEDGPASKSWTHWLQRMMHRFDISIVRVHQHGACIVGNSQQHVGPLAWRPDDQDSRGRRRQWSAGTDRTYAREMHDNRLCSVLLSELRPHTILLADRVCDVDWIRTIAIEQGARAKIPPQQRGDLLQPLSVPGAQLGRSVLQ